MSDLAKDESAIRGQLARINEAWQHQRGEALAATLNECFADDVVMRGPDFALAGKGRVAAVQSYVDFTSQAEVKAFTAEEPAIDVSGDTAIASYKWQMTYLLAGQENAEQGHDIFAFSRRAGKWLVIWRVLLSS